MKRLIKKPNCGKGDWLVDQELNDWEDMPSAYREKKKRTRDFEKEGREKVEGRKKEKGLEMERRKDGKGEKGAYENTTVTESEEEVQEMWNTVAGDGSENDQEGPRAVDNDNFIDDTGVDGADRYGSDNDCSQTHLPQAEKDDEISTLFKSGKKRKKNEKLPQEIASTVEILLAEFEVMAEEDAELNRQSKPAIMKLRKLPLLIDALSKKKLQQEFLDHGVLSLLKNWLEPLPDGSLPNMNIRSAILKILADYPIDLDQCDRREQLKKSGLGKIIMFLSKSVEETTANRKLAKELVEKWSRHIFNKSLRFEDMTNCDDQRAQNRRSALKTAMCLEPKDDELDFTIASQDPNSGQGGSSRHYITRPEPSVLDYAIRPQSKVDAEQIRARAKQYVPDPRRQNIQKKLKQLKAARRKNLRGIFNGH